MRPRIICHMATSIDGRLHPSKFTVPAAGIASATLRQHYESVAEKFSSEGWIVGRKTMAEMAKGASGNGQFVSVGERNPYIGSRKGRNLAIAIDPSGRVHYASDNVHGDHVLAVVGEDVGGDYLAELRDKGVSYLFAGKDGRDLATAMDQISELFDVKLLLLEGGGSINGAFLKARLIDEFSTLIHPAVDGRRGEQSIVDYDGNDNIHPGLGQSLRLISCEVLDGGMVWLRHRVEVAE